MSTPATPRWFLIREGEHEGKIHLAGWRLSAIKGEGFYVQGREVYDGWLSYATCPRCFAMVVSDDKNGHVDRTWDHEMWHAATDYPIPNEVLAEATRWMTKIRDDSQVDGLGG